MSRTGSRQHPLCLFCFGDLQESAETAERATIPRFTPGEPDIRSGEARWRVRVAPLPSTRGYLRGRSAAVNSLSTFLFNDLLNCCFCEANPEPYRVRSAPGAIGRQGKRAVNAWNNESGDWRRTRRGDRPPESEAPPIRVKRPPRRRFTRSVYSPAWRRLPARSRPSAVSPGRRSKPIRSDAPPPPPANGESAAG